MKQLRVSRYQLKLRARHLFRQNYPLQFLPPQPLLLQKDTLSMTRREVPFSGRQIRNHSQEMKRRAIHPERQKHPVMLVALILRLSANHSKSPGFLLKDCHSTELGASEILGTRTVRSRSQETEQSWSRPSGGGYWLCSTVRQCIRILQYPVDHKHKGLFMGLDNSTRDPRIDVSSSLARATHSLDFTFTEIKFLQQQSPLFGFYAGNRTSLQVKCSFDGARNRGHALRTVRRTRC